jgi:hypothetical protein
MIVTKDSLVTALRRVGVLGAVNAGYFDHLFEADGTAKKVGWFSYDNLNETQDIPPNVWTTIMNDGAGSGTNTQYAPTGVTRMLDTNTGRILLDQLQLGDEVYIRHIINVIPNVNNLKYTISHFFGDGPQSERLPLGPQTLLMAGAGAATEQYLLDTHFFMDRENTRQFGVVPQIFTTGPLTIQYTGCYISIIRSK